MQYNIQSDAITLTTLKYSATVIVHILDFTVNRLFMKLFKTGSIEIVKQSQEYFNFEIPSVLWTKRVSKFESKLTNTDNMFCKYLV